MLYFWPHLFTFNDGFLCWVFGAVNSLFSFCFPCTQPAQSTHRVDCGGPGHLWRVDMVRSSLPGLPCLVCPFPFLRSFGSRASAVSFVFSPRADRTARFEPSTRPSTTGMRRLCRPSNQAIFYQVRHGRRELVLCFFFSSLQFGSLLCVLCPESLVYDAVWFCECPVPVRPPLYLAVKFLSV